MVCTIYQKSTYIINYSLYLRTYLPSVKIFTPLDPKTMKNEGFTPPKYGLEPLKMKVVGSHGTYCSKHHFCWSRWGADQTSSEAERWGTRDVDQGDFLWIPWILLVVTYQDIHVCIYNISIYIYKSCFSFKGFVTRWPWVRGLMKLWVGNFIRFAGRPNWRNGRKRTNKSHLRIKCFLKIDPKLLIMFQAIRQYSCWRTMAAFECFHENGRWSNCVLEHVWPGLF